MNPNQSYVVVYQTLEQEAGNEKTVAFFETKEAMHAFLLPLHQTFNQTNQRLSYFAEVYPQGALYPLNYEAFHQSWRDKHRKRHGTPKDYFVHRKYKNGTVKQRTYVSSSEFDYRLEDWAKTCTELFVLHQNEGFRGDYYVDSELLHYWGQKHAPLIGS